MTQRIHEGFVRHVHADTFLMPGAAAQILEHDPSRLHASIFIGTNMDVGVSTNPFGQIGDPDVTVFRTATGPCRFETYGTNALYVITPQSTFYLGKATVVRTGKNLYAYPQSQAVNVEKIMTVTGGGAVPAAVGNFQAFLPADPQRQRATIVTDSVLALISDGVDATNFTPSATYYPGFAVVESAGIIAFSTQGGAHVNNAWYIIDKRVPSTS